MTNKIKVEQEQSKKYKLNKADGMKILKSFGLASGGFLLTYVSQLVTQIDFGQYTSLVYAISPAIINFFRKLLVGK